MAFLESARQALWSGHYLLETMPKAGAGPEVVSVLRRLAGHLEATEMQVLALSHEQINEAAEVVEQLVGLMRAWAKASRGAGPAIFI